tara:strand:- start:2211 stop:2474 length:264 start_codon:yes stop_codon:yes gene_type:complete
MIKEIKYLIFTIIIFIFLFFTARYYFSDHNIKKSYRSLTNINNKINLYAESLPILENNTNDIIEYINETKTKKKKKYNFWELLDKND